MAWLVPIWFEPAGAAVPAAHTAVALNINLELQRAVVHWKHSVSDPAVISVTVDSKSGSYSALHVRQGIPRL